MRAFDINNIDEINNGMAIRYGYVFTSVLSSNVLCYFECANEQKQTYSTLYILALIISYFKNG